MQHVARDALPRRIGSLWGMLLALMLALPALAQGVGAGLVALLAYNRAAALLGAGRAALFGALVPGAASLLAIPVLGEVPSALQVLGIVSVIVGLLIAFGVAGLLLRRPGGTASG